MFPSRHAYRIIAITNLAIKTYIRHPAQGVKIPEHAPPIGIPPALQVIRQDNTFANPTTERNITMTRLIAQLHQDEAGFIVSAELVLVATICVLGMLVGLAELALNINNELEDVGSAFQCMQQSYCVDGVNGHKGWSSGSHFNDSADFCAGQRDIW